MIECVFVDIFIFIKLLLALVIELNTNNSYTKKDSPENFFINLNYMSPMVMHASAALLSYSSWLHFSVLPSSNKIS